MSFDLKDFDLAEKAETGFTLRLRHPGKPGEMLAMEIDLVGMDSQTYKGAAKRMQAAIKQAGSDQEKRREAECRLLAECTRGWRNAVEGGKEVTFKFEAAFDLYRRHEWIFEQVNVAVADRSKLF